MGRLAWRHIPGNWWAESRIGQSCYKMSERFLETDLLETTLGWIGVLSSVHGIRALTLPHPTHDEAINHMPTDAKFAQRKPGAFSSLHAKLDQYFSGRLVTFDEVLDLDKSSHFFLAVWKECQNIPIGQTRSYAWLAAQAGHPSAARAAGQAMARNQIPIIIPCHRVISSDGSIGGYSGGLSMKKYLLSLEQLYLASRRHSSTHSP